MLLKMASKPRTQIKVVYEEMYSRVAQISKICLQERSPDRHMGDWISHSRKDIAFWIEGINLVGVGKAW